MRCRRCFSPRLILLAKKCARDNEILRCQECGFLFSPRLARKAASESSPVGSPNDSPEAPRKSG